MAQAIVIIGGLGDDADRNAMLDELQRKSGPEIEWDWVKAAECDGYNIPNNQLRRLWARFSNPSSLSERPRVVSLFRLHGRVLHGLYKVCRDPTHAPKHIDCQCDLVEWLFSAEANLIPQHEWYANCEEAALVAILSKLIKNKSWNKDPRGHEWTKEEDLLGQAPVFRPEFPEVAKEAAKMLLALRNVLLLCKGGSQGKTPREWSIRFSSLPIVKQMIIEESVPRLSDVPQFASIVARIRKHDNRPYRLDDEVVTERVRHICRPRT